MLNTSSIEKLLMLKVSFSNSLDKFIDLLLSKDDIFLICLVIFKNNFYMNF